MDNVTEEIRQRADIVDIVGQYVALRPAGANRWKACCPFHDEKTPSFNVSRDKGFFHCFGCKASGDVFKFLQRVENISFPEAKKQLAERYGVVLRPDRELTPAQQAAYAERDRLLKVMAATTAFFREQLSGNHGLVARDYARSRGLSGGTLERFSIGYAPDAWEALHHHLLNKYGFKTEDAVACGLLIERTQDDGRVRVYDRYRYRLMFPIWDQQGRTIAFGGRALEGGNTGSSDAKYINSPEGTLFKKSQVLYGWHIARSEVGRRESVIITEGYMDTIALHEAGFTNTMATLGTALTQQHVLALQRLSPRTVYLCYDGDSAGMQAALRAGPMFAANQLDVRIVTLPGGDDPDTYIRKHGDIGFQNLLNAARPVAQYRLEMAIAEFDMTNVLQRAEAVRSAAQVLATVPNETERNGYIDWLADRWGQAEGSTDPSRIQLAQTAIRREVEAVNRIQAPAQPRNIWQQRQRDAEVARVQDNQAISETTANKSSGVTRAERLLLCSLLGSPSWRSRILNDLPPEQWTQELHGEVAIALRKFDDNAPVNPAELMEKLSPEAEVLVSELMLSDEAQTPLDESVVQDCIARVKKHWDKQREKEMLEYVQLKLERGEAITPEEHAALSAALIKTGRKAAVPTE